MIALAVVVVVVLAQQRRRGTEPLFSNVFFSSQFFQFPI
jgi:hypothetical protein